jgi:hypothetical protein
MSIVGYSETLGAWLRAEENLAGREPVRFVVNRNKTAFPKLDSNTSVGVLSFLNSRDIFRFLNTSTAAQRLKETQNDALERLIFSQVPIMSLAEEYFRFKRQHRVFS